VPICAVCGFDNPDGFRFCGACAAPLEAATGAERETRRTVTVVFCDVTGSTSLGERLDPESLRRVMARYFETMCQMIERHGGTVEKFIGDAVMAVFGVPVLHEDDALRAVRAAAEMRQALVELNAELERDYETTLAVRIGVNTGEVVTGTEERLATGDAVNVASRLEQAAAPGEILIGAETLALIRDAVDAEPLEPLELKGKAERLAAWRLLGLRAGAPGYRRRLDTAMVGRERQCALLESAFENAVVERTCSLFTIIGSAGVGKSRLAAEFLANVDATVLQGRCLSYGEGITYSPVIEVVTQLLGADAEARLGDFELDDAARSALADLLGDVRAASSSEEIAWAVRRLLESAAGERPTIVVLDDLQWAEPTFLDLVEHIADLSRDAPILLLCMARQELLDRRPGWGGGMLNSTTVLLEPLLPEETEELIDGLLGEEQLDEPVRKRIELAAEGNPLFVEEMLVMLRERVDRSAEVSVPPTIQALLAARLDQLEPSERVVLERGAVEGKVFHRASVLALGPDEPQLSVRLTALVRKELLRPERPTLTRGDAYRFRHQLIRDAAYDALPKAVRAELHERFAAWLDAEGQDLVEQSELLGYHLEQAFRYRGELGPLDPHGRHLAVRAGMHLAEAGSRALDRGDATGARNLLDRAAELLPGADPSRRRLLPELGAALIDVGEFDRARAVLDEAIDAARAAGDAPAEALAHIQQQYLRNATGGLIREELLEAQAAANALEPLGDAAALAQAKTLVGVLQFWLGDCAAAGRELQQAIDRGGEGVSPRLRSEALSWLAIVAHFGPTPTEQAIRFCETLLEEPGGTRKLESQALLSGGAMYAMSGRFDEARATVARALEITLSLGARVNWAAQSMEAAKVELLADDPAAAERISRESYELMEQLGEKAYLSSIATRLARALYLQGRHDEAERITRTSEDAAADDDVSAQTEWRSIRALVLATRGECAEAETLAREAVALIERTDYIDAHADALVDLAEVLGRSGQEEQALAVAENGLRLYEQKGNVVSAGKARALLAELEDTRARRIRAG
jgi:class 3 adenylate cyclase/tetratricopeptide (TPR) repeat protein